MNALTALADMTIDDLIDRVAEAVAAKVERKDASDAKPLTAKVLAAMLGISVQTLYRRVDRGEFPAPAYGGTGNGSTGVWLRSQLKF